jgi:hypothetical protein
VECGQRSYCRPDSGSEVCSGTCAPMPRSKCRTSGDCGDERYYCAVSSTTGSGVGTVGQCEAFIPAGTSRGDECGRPVACAPGLACQSSGIAYSCAPYAGEGTTCRLGLVYVWCRSDLACVPSNDDSISTCGPQAELGDACTSLFQCGAHYQVSDIICDEQDSHVCVRKPSTGPCVVVPGTYTCDPATSYCDVASATCMPWLSEGAACDPQASIIDPCGPYGRCDRNVCRPRARGCISG